MADSNTPSASNNDSNPPQCAKCGNTDNLKRCAKCHTTQYCTRECQKADWKEHKKTCSGNAASRNTSGSASTAGNTSSTGTQSAPKALIADLKKPFTALQEKKWLHNRPEKDVYKLLIDACRLRLDDDYKFSGDCDDDSIYGGASNGYGHFRKFLRKAENKAGLLPPWWSQGKAAECMRLGQQPGWSDLNCAIEKSDIMEHYGDADMPMQMRMFVESIYGSGPGGQNGTAMLEIKIMAENGSFHISRG